MKCPVCLEVGLVMTDRQGIEVDYCPQCRGVWLDRGELDKIIDRAAAPIAPQAPIAPPQQWQQPEPQWRQPEPPPRPAEARPYPPRPDYHDDDDHRYDPHRKKKRGGFLGELFDFS